MFNQVLEYRRFVQTFRSEAEKRDKLLALAAKIKGDDPITKRAEAILGAYLRGEDILDPELFDREDIVIFAKENQIQDDPQVVSFIEKAKQRA